MVNPDRGRRLSDLDRRLPWLPSPGLDLPRIYGTMSDDDLRKMFGYLRTVPAKGQKTRNQAKG
jgi:hypothetical protein